MDKHIICCWIILLYETIDKIITKITSLALIGKQNLNDMEVKKVLE